MTLTQRNGIAGAIFDFAGFLTAHKKVIAVGSTASASPMVSRIQEWAEARGLSLESPNVTAWNEELAEPAPEPAAEIYAPSYLPRAIGLRFTHYGTTLPAGTKLYAAPLHEPAPQPPADVPTPQIKNSPTRTGVFAYIDAEVRKDMSGFYEALNRPQPPVPANVPLLTKFNV